MAAALGAIISRRREMPASHSDTQLAIDSKFSAYMFCPPSVHLLHTMVHCARPHTIGLHTVVHFPRP